jgi:hypothetical protein
MLRVLSASALALFAAIFVASPALATEPERPTTVRIIHGTLTGSDGQTVKFSIPEGRGLRIKDKTSDQTYRLVPESLASNRVKLAVIDSLSTQVVDRFDLGLDGKPKAGLNTPFAIALTGVTVERTTTRHQKCGPAAIAKTLGAGEPSPEAECCINCGDWRVCCEPAPGWCCRLECEEGEVANAGETCEACTSEQ